MLNTTTKKSIKKTSCICHWVTLAEFASTTKETGEYSWFSSIHSGWSSKSFKINEDFTCKLYVSSSSDVTEHPLPLNTTLFLPLLSCLSLSLTEVIWHSFLCLANPLLINSTKTIFVFADISRIVVVKITCHFKKNTLVPSCSLLICSCSCWSTHNYNLWTSPLKPSFQIIVVHFNLWKYIIMHKWCVFCLFVCRYGYRYLYKVCVLKLKSKKIIKKKLFKPRMITWL